ncbi:hypothetical protein SODALDRAFT_321886 [Sodiomyces alkalinus F11]|uniref:Uncharacterized protein n=1 Tax=Sodiomyces alkalinus (strain CBS 110278 / VKM F-3762 / F11) TaxID=1314773 RepID=A0A3N2Q1B9_SODAK|nr:hypothetical protein SODALDRAFT_321886 [Sodiomyces alkalinus F11]ROT40559.1 hypothetical protein SODALDRAFT_321886 [Sodiomyces alkalinus F11]
MKHPQPLFVLLSLCLLTCGSRAEDETTVPIFLPYYSSKSWSLVRGSIVTSNADETIYTIFCAPQTISHHCDLALEFPFIFAEGDQTLRFEGTRTSTYTVNLECQLGGTTAATCSAYSSLRSGYVAGIHTGPTEVTWESTLSGTEVQWGILTLAEQPTETTTNDLLSPPTSADDLVATDGFLYDGTLPTGTEPIPVETQPSAASQNAINLLRIWSICGVLFAAQFAI